MRGLSRWSFDISDAQLHVIVSTMMLIEWNALMNIACFRAGADFGLMYLLPSQYRISGVARRAAPLLGFIKFLILT